MTTIFCVHKFTDPVENQLHVTVLWMKIVGNEVKITQKNNLISKIMTAIDQ